MHRVVKLGIIPLGERRSTNCLPTGTCMSNPVKFTARRPFHHAIEIVVAKLAI